MLSLHNKEVKTPSLNPGQKPQEMLWDIQAGKRDTKAFGKQYLLVCQQQLSEFPSKG
jgi:hypothetical protein